MYTDRKQITKRTLITVSHAIEQAALAPTTAAEPMLMIALFQRLPYFERERAVYERIVDRATVCALAMVADPDEPGRDVAGAYTVLLHDSEELAREWSVVLLTPRTGAVLVAHDREELVPGADTLEHSRTFDGWWSFLRRDAHGEALRLRDELRDRLPAEALAAMDAMFDRVAGTPPDPSEARADASLRLVTAEMERARRRTDGFRQAEDDRVERDQLTGMFSVDYLQRWLGGSTSATGTLPLALVAIEVAELDGVYDRYGVRTGKQLLQSIAAEIRLPLRPMDRAVQLDDSTFLLVLPSLSEERAVQVCQQIWTGVTALGQRHPFVTPTTTMAIVVSSERPVPLDRLQSALEWARAERVGIATLPGDEAAA